MPLASVALECCAIITIEFSFSIPDANVQAFSREISKVGAVREYIEELQVFTGGSEWHDPRLCTPPTGTKCMLCFQVVSITHLNGDVFWISALLLLAFCYALDVKV